MPYFVYVSLAGEGKIAIWAMDPATGKLTFQEDVVVQGGPAPLAVDPMQNILYAGLRSSLQVASYRIDHSTGGLSLLGKTALESDPCYLSTDRTGRFLLSSYYRAGRVAVHAIGEDGVVVGPPVEWRATAEKAHSIQTDASNRFVFVPHVMVDNVIMQYVFDQETGRLTPNAVPCVVPDSDWGPRHFCFHPSQDVVYFSDEQGCSVSAYRFDPDSGTLQAFQTISTLPDGFEGQNTGAQIHITPSGKFLYAVNRGHNSVAGFAVDAFTGRLTALGQQPTEAVPRVFNIDPRGQFLYAAGQVSGRLAAYRIDPQTGSLIPLATYTVGARPMWVLILDLAD
jgi:6-phosphogluconolactonase